MSYYANTMYVLNGALAYKDMLTMINLTNGAVQRQVLRARGVNEQAIMGRIQPVVVDPHYIGNPMTHYGVYINSVILPGMLGLVILLIVVYSLGSELKYGTSRHLLKMAGGSMGTALAGKLIPYTVLFTVLGILLELVLYHWMGYPMNGSLWNMFLVIFVMVLAYEALAVFLIGLVPTLRMALSISSLYSILGFSLAGFTLPVSALPPPIQGVSNLFPLRFYYQISFREAIYATGFAGWWPYLVCLLCFLLLPALTVRRLEKAYIRLDYPRN